MNSWVGLLGVGLLAMGAAAPMARADVYVGQVRSKHLRISYQANAYRFYACNDIGQGCASLTTQSYTWEVLEKGLSKLRSQIVKETDRRAAKRVNWVLNDADQKELAPFVADALAVSQLVGLLKEIDRNGYGRVGFEGKDDVLYPSFLDTDQLVKSLKQALPKIAPPRLVPVR
jgi:hypothetical protein